MVATPIGVLNYRNFEQSSIVDDLPFSEMLVIKVIDITRSQATTQMQNSAMTANVTKRSVEKAIIAAVEQHKASSISTQKVDKISSDSIVKIVDGYKYDYTVGELRYERTVFYIVPYTNNAIGEYTTTTVLPLS